MSAAITPAYRSSTYDGRGLTGLDGGVIYETREGKTIFYQTPRVRQSMIPQERTPRRVRMRAGVVEHISNRWNGTQRFRVIERMRAESMGVGPTIYGWRACAAVEVTR